MDSFNPNRVLHSNQGNMWFNGKRLSTLQSVEAKVTGDFEEVNNCGDPATYRIYNGYSGEGTFTMLKIDSEVLKLMADAFQTGEMPTMTIITALEQKGTNKVERIAYRDVTIDEMYLAKFEKKSKIEEEVPFKFGHFEVLETI
jgi:hypothetical protein|nr:MAG TPA: tail tube protein [Caudoviricetes sp.]